MLRSRHRHRSFPRRLLELALAAAGAWFVWWLLNLAFPDRMQGLVEAAKGLL